MYIVNTRTTTNFVFEDYNWATTFTRKEHIWGPTIASQYHFLLKGTKIPWRNGWLQGWCRGSKRCSWTIVTLQSMWKWVTLSCLTLWDPMDCSLPDSSVHGILLASVLEWVAMTSSSRSFQPSDRTQVSHNAGRFFTTWATSEAQRIQKHFKMTQKPEWMSSQWPNWEKLSI